MIKKISTYIFLITFSTVVSAQAILMDCKTGKYRYINNNSGAKILYTHKKSKIAFEEFKKNKRFE